MAVFLSGTSSTFTLRALAVLHGTRFLAVDPVSYIWSLDY